MTVIVYPNNDVCVDGHFTEWSVDQFKMAGVPLLRPESSKFIQDNGWVIRNNGTTIKVFATNHKAGFKFFKKRQKQVHLKEGTINDTSSGD